MQLSASRIQIDWGSVSQSKAVNKILLYATGATLFGLELIAKDGTKLYEICWPYFRSSKKLETILEDDEQIIGIKIRKHSKDYEAHHEDF